MKTLALLATFFVAISFSSFALINGAPPRVHPNNNVINGLVNSQINQKSSNPDQLPEEELELENLKANSKSRPRSDLHKEFPFDTTNAADKRSSDAAPDSSSATSGKEQQSIPARHTKLPVNEETPAVSDNANSEKFRLSLPQGTFGFISPLKSEDKRRLVLPGVGSLLLGNSPSRFNGYDNPNMNGLDVDYTPQDIAEYIFWTGEEKSVTQALNDFLQEGLVSRDDAISFWEDVKLELAQLKNRYSMQTQQQVNQDTNSLDFSDKWSDYKAKIRRNNNGIFHDITAVKKQMDTEYGPGDFGLFDLRNRENNLPNLRNPIREKPQGFATSTLAVSGEDLDYEELVDKIRQADAKLREYSLEGVIYQLAKELFSQGLHEQPQVSIQRFARFIEAEAAEGHIPKDLEKAVLDTLVGALMDAVSERGNSRAGAQINPPPKPTQPQPQKLLKV